MIRKPLSWLAGSASIRLIALGLCLASAGCGTTTPVPVYKASGEVFVAGQPATGATVIFYPQDPNAPRYFPAAVVEPNGSFRLTTFGDYDGAPAGDYNITVIWSLSYREEGERMVDPDLLEGRYGYADTSELKASILRRKNSIPRLDLEGQPVQ